MSRPAPRESVGSQGVQVVPKTVGVLALLLLALPFNLALTALLVQICLRRAPAQAIGRPTRTVLVSGGKMTKSLQLARSFHAAGHRVIMVESAKYRLTGHRFSLRWIASITVPKPQSPAV